MLFLSYLLHTSKVVTPTHKLCVDVQKKNKNQDVYNIIIMIFYYICVVKP